MPKLAAGVVKFQNEVYPQKKDLFEALAKGQSPEALFITCSDSRIDPCLLTQTEPGELFICRNAGNIVPPHMNHTGAMTASIEFAVGALDVPHVIVCGHSECGAMKGALDRSGLDAFPHVSAWLNYSKAAVQIVEAKAPDADAETKLKMLIEENVLLQLQHLKSHPYVAARLATGDIQLHGWVYDLKTGRVDAYDEEKRGFIPVDERYAEDVARYAQISGGGCA